VRTRVHEYGGGEHLVLPDGRAVFSNFRWASACPASAQQAHGRVLALGLPWLWHPGPECCLNRRLVSNTSSPPPPNPNPTHPPLSDQRVYVQALAPGSPAQPLTAEGSGQRFADYCWDGPRGRLVAVCEDHSEPSKEAVNFVAAIGGLGQPGLGSQRQDGLALGRAWGPAGCQGRRPASGRAPTCFAPRWLRANVLSV
jgi:hypothetical protein